MQRFLMACALGGVLCLTGCGRSDVAEILETFPVGGLVTINGQPAEGVSVTFLPTGSTPGQGGFAVTGTGGVFRVQAIDGRDGVPQGEYKVLLTKWTLPDGSPIPAGATAADTGAINQLPELHNDPAQSPLVTVVAGENPEVSVDIKTRKLGRR